MPSLLPGHCTWQTQPASFVGPERRRRTERKPPCATIPLRKSRAGFPLGNDVLVAVRWPGLPVAPALPSARPGGLLADRPRACPWWPWSACWWGSWRACPAQIGGGWSASGGLPWWAAQIGPGAGLLLLVGGAAGGPGGRPAWPAPAGQLLAGGPAERAGQWGREGAGLLLVGLVVSRPWWGWPWWAGELLADPGGLPCSCWWAPGWSAPGPAGVPGLVCLPPCRAGGLLAGGPACRTGGAAGLACWWARSRPGGLLAGGPAQSRAGGAGGWCSLLLRCLLVFLPSARPGERACFRWGWPLVCPAW